ncbi:endonuclease MutS2 [Hutsoniella sourekii]
MPISKHLLTLEFDRIQETMRKYTLTELGQRLAQEIQPINHLSKVERLQDECQEMVDLLEEDLQFPIARQDRLEASLKRLDLQANLNGPEIAEIYRLLESARQVVDFMDRSRSDLEAEFPRLMAWVEGIQVLKEVTQRISRTISEDGSVLSNASTELARIIRRQQQIDDQIRNQLNQMVKSLSSYLSDSLVTIRNDRYVLPVKSEYRGQVHGTIHDQSSTGQTLYIEPQVVQNLNNQRSQLQIDKDQEIARILAELSAYLWDYRQQIKNNQSIVGNLDFIQARALYSRSIDGTRPNFNDQGQVALWQARHPLIDPDQIVANDIVLGDTYSTLLITGPNTGGKTILLKTLGLVQAMGQAGIFVPCGPNSQLAIFDHIYADIGDEQSIEQSLSTFSGHMTNIVSILDEMTSGSLLLFDELGSGTDPQEGAALAMAILDYVGQVGATCMATTHYPELKVYAHETPGIINASMEFDVNTLSPTYKLLIGVPGRSNALEISKRLGLSPAILDKAQAGVSHDNQQLNEMVAGLEIERRQAEARRRQWTQRIEEVNKLYRDLDREYQGWLKHKTDLMDKAKQEANDKVEEAQAEADKIIQEIRQLQLQQGQNTTIKEHELIDQQTALKDLKQPVELRKNKVLKREKAKRQIEVGDDVEVLSYGQRGTVIEQSGPQEYVVQMGILKMKIDQEDLRLLDKVDNDKKRSVNVQRGASSKVSTSLDLRGQRYEAAMRATKDYLDKALLSHHPMVTIIHGKGTGALRQGIQKLLANHPQVDRFEYAPANAGGNGATQVYFK